MRAFFVSEICHLLVGGFWSKSLINQLVMRIRATCDSGVCKPKPRQIIGNINTEATHRFTWRNYMEAVGKVGDVFGLGMHWVLIHKVSEYTGYSDDAIRAKKQRGEWKEGVHWRKGPDNRLMFNLVAIQKWMGGLYV